MHYPTYDVTVDSISLGGELDCMAEKLPTFPPLIDEILIWVEQQTLCENLGIQFHLNTLR